MLKKSKILSGVMAFAGCAALSVSAHGAPFSFDPDGAGPEAVIPNANTFDYLPANVLSIGGAAAVQAGVGAQFTTYFHSRLGVILSSISTDVTPTSLSSGSEEITIVGGFGEIVTFSQGGPPNANVAIFSHDNTNPTNFIEIWHHTAPDASDLGGTGFNNGTLILSAVVTAVSTNFTATGGGPGTDLDQFGGFDNYAGIDTIVGNGGTSLSANVTFFDPAYFGAPFGNAGIINFSLLNTSQILAFNQVDPSAAFALLAGGVAPVLSGAGTGGTPGVGIGSINGFNGPDIQFQADANQTFELRNAIVPEPVTGMLGMMGLGVLAAGIKRRR